MCIGGGVGEGGRYSAHRDQKEESDVLELEGQVGCEPPIGTGSGPWELSQLSSPTPTLLPTHGILKETRSKLIKENRSIAVWPSWGKSGPWFSSIFS